MNGPEVIKKLRLDKVTKRLIVNAPKEYLDILKGVEYDTKLLKKNEGQYEFVQVFASTQNELEKIVVQVGKAGIKDCLFWASYPKGTGKIKSDIKRDTVWIAFDLIGLQAVSQIAIDDTWSALRARPKDLVGK